MGVYFVIVVNLGFTFTCLVSPTTQRPSVFWLGFKALRLLLLKSVAFCASEIRNCSAFLSASTVRYF